MGGKINPFEAEFCVGLAEYLVLQGVASSRISILTPYSAQSRLEILLDTILKLGIMFSCNYVFYM